jgi:uncharacterized membrane protein
MVTDAAPYKRPTPLAILLVVGGVLGFLAAFELTIDKFQALADPASVHHLNCDVSVIVQCSVNLGSAQGSAFGFPNSVIGLAGYFTVLVVGMAILAGARFARWFWLVFNLGLLFAIGFVIWLMGQSIFILGTLCPWCMVVWVVTIPIFFAVTLRNFSEGAIASPPGFRRFATAARSWVPLISLVCYLIIAVIAQLRLDVLHHL